MTEAYDESWDEWEILKCLQQSKIPLSAYKISLLTNIPQLRVRRKLKELESRNLIGFVAILTSEARPEGRSSQDDQSLPDQSYRDDQNLYVKAVKKGGSDFKYFWLTKGGGKEWIYIGGGNTTTPLAQKYKAAVEAVIEGGEFEGLDRAAAKKLIAQIKSQVLETHSLNSKA